jgi:hypothetical protein
VAVGRRTPITMAVALIEYPEEFESYQPKVSRAARRLVLLKGKPSEIAALARKAS